MVSRLVSYRMDDDRQILQQYPWDFRGIDNLLKAALLHAPKLRELLIGCQNSNLSEEIYGRPDIVVTATELVSRLSLLKIDASGRRQAADQPLDPVATILQRSHQLEELHLTRYYGMTALIRKWSQLRVLDLGDEYVEWESFEEVIHSCAKTLRELRLRHMHLYGKAWEDCSRDLGPGLRLRFVSIQSMTDDVASASNHEPFSYLELRQMQLTACNFMSSVP